MGLLKEFLELLEKGDIDAIEAKLKYCKENHPEYDTDIIEFNLMLNDGAHTREECYDWLHKRKFKREQEFYEKHGIYMDMSFNYLYPEIMFPCKI